MINDSNAAVLVIFCRRPGLGCGKQRIAAELGKPAALHIANLLLAAVVEDARAWRGDVILAPASAADTQWAQDLMPQARVIPQPAGNLGERINDVDTRARATGARHVLFIGSDAPGLTLADLESAAAALQDHAAVFIPATDGGVTLLGANKSWPDLASLPWETDELCNALTRRCESVGWNCATLETGFDVDTRVDLILTAERLALDPRPARQKLCRWISSAALEHLQPITDPPAPDSVSVVIPVYRDPEALDRLLNQIAGLESAPDEILVIDGSASKACRELCAQHNVSYFATDACRGSQLHFGATLARSETLWFLHADAEPANDAVRLIREHIAVGNIGGYFQFRFTGMRSWYKWLLENAINLRARYGIPYGDQGLFVRQSDYCAVGGFAPTPLFEEVPLVRKLRRRGTFTAVQAPIGVASRRWERDGWLQRTCRNRMLALRYMLGVSPQKLARDYQPKLNSNDTD